MLVALPDDDEAIGALRLTEAPQPMCVGRGLAHEQDVVAPLRNLVGEMSEQAQEEGV